MGPRDGPNVVAKRKYPALNKNRIPVAQSAANLQTKLFRHLAGCTGFESRSGY